MKHTAGLMSRKEASQFGKALYKRLAENQSQTEHLFEQIFVNNVRNIEKKITDEEAQQKMSMELVNYTNDISRQFSSSREKEIAQGIIPYIMLEYVSDTSAQLVDLGIPNDAEIQNNQSNNNMPINKDFIESFKKNLERLKPSILENIAKHWKSIAGSAVLGATAYAATKFVLGFSAKEAILMGGGLGLALFIGWEVYEHFAKK